MEPYSATVATAGAEALRWLGIAEKLLTTRDLIGSKTFAIRSRESDPQLEPANQILAVADTLLAGDKRINNSHHDWYAVLQLVRGTRDSELIAAQYRRFALLLNPHQNHLPFADQAFKLVSDAWSVLSNPSRKLLYDNELNLHFRPDPVVESSRQQEKQKQPFHNTVHDLRMPEKTVTRSHRKSVNDNMREEEGISNTPFTRENDDKTASFWTACPYCYNMYEYPRVYAECTLRCQNCKRAFHGVVIAAPPPIFDGKEGYFCCWGFFPMGISTSNLQKNKGVGSSWSPFSPMFTCPQVVEGKYGGEKNVNGGKKSNVRKNSAPRIYIDDDQDVFVEVSESSEDSDDEWGSTRKKRKAKSAKGKGSVNKNVKQVQGDKAKNVKGGIDENLQGGFVMQEGAGVAETSKKAAGSSAKRQMGRAAKDMGKLDLNVEFSNEVEEPAPGMGVGNRAGHGEEDNIEGIGFFEGLDEFLSSLPILSTVGDDKVKAAQ